MQQRLYDFDKVINFRDFGGYATSYGGWVKPGALFRSGHYAQASETDIAALDAMPIRLQADLRRPDERERQPGKWSAPSLITDDGGRESDAPHTRFLQQVEASPQIAEDWMNEYYSLAPFRPHHIAQFSSWFEQLAGLAEGEAALVNCAAGKDRTGILCAITQSVLGVSEDDIRTDYELTNKAARVEERIEEIAARFNAHIGKDYDSEVYRPFIGVKLRYLETAFDAIRKQAGSTEAYCENVLGLTGSMQDALRARLITPTIRPHG